MKFKTYLSAILLFVVSLAHAQKDFVWTEVVKVDSTLTQKELYNRAKLYVAKNFVSGKDVTQMNNDDAFTIVIKPSHEAPGIKGMGASFTTLEGGYVHYTVTIIVKDGRYKYTIDDVVHVGIGKISSCGPLANETPSLSTMQGGVPTKYWKEKLKPDFVTYIDGFIKDLKENLGKKVASSDF